MTAKFLIGGTGSSALLACFGMTDVQSAPAAEASVVLEEVIVTGSRIQTLGVSSATPLTVQRAKQFRQTAPSSVDDIVAQPTAFRPTSGPNQVHRNAGSVSTAQSLANLRGLGAERTLMLSNGQR